MIPMTKICTTCLIEKPYSAFYTKDGGKYLRSKCAKCTNQHIKEKPAYIERMRISAKKKYLSKKLDPIRNRAYYINRICHKSDKKYGRECDLTELMIKEIIQRGCCYCGKKWTESKMTLDRIDNVRGHTHDNVVPACANCNQIRGSLPFEVWQQFFVPAVRQAVASGMLDGWKANKYS